MGRQGGGEGGVMGGRVMGQRDRGQVGADVWGQGVFIFELRNKY